MDVISDKTDVLRILPKAAADLCTALFRNSPAGIYITRDGKFIYTNIEFRRITGYSQDELSGKDYLRLINPRYRHMPKQNMAPLFEEEEENTSHEFKITTHEGKKRWISEKITYFKYGGNWLTLGHWMDITDSHSVEKAWREAEKRFQSAFEDLTTGLAIIGTDGIFLKVNKAFCDMLSYEEREILENRFDDVVCPEDREQCGDIMALFLSLDKPEIPAQRRLQSRDGRVVWTAMSISLIGDTESGPTYFIVHFQDITEQKRIEDGLKEEEQLYRSLVDLSLEPLAVTDLDYHITHTSQKFIKLLGYENAADLLGKKIGSLVKSGESENFHLQILDILRSSQPGKLNFSLLRKDGSELDSIINITWINNDKGAPYCIVIQSGEIREAAQVPPTEKHSEEKPALKTEKTAEETKDVGPAVVQPVEAPAAVSELTLALENTSTALILMDADTTIAAVNKAFEKMSGYSREEIEGRKSWIEFVAKEDQPRLKRYYLLRRLDPASSPNTYEFKFADRDGNLKDVLINITDVPGTKRQAATLLEVAEYKQAMQETQVSANPPEDPQKQTNQTLDDESLTYLNALPNSVAVVDTAGIITYASPAAIQAIASGISTDVIGKSYLKFIRPGMGEDARADFQWLLDRGTLLNREYELVRTDGQVYPAELSAKIYQNEAGETAGAVFVFKDVTRQKLAEQARDEIEKNYRLLAENTSDIISILDKDLRTTWISPSYTRSSGFTLEELQTLPVERLWPPESVQIVTDLFTTAVEDEWAGRCGPDSHYDAELEVYRKDGSLHWTETRFQFIRDEQGKAVGAMIQGRDITGRKLAELARDEIEKNYRLLAENTCDIVSILDLNLHTVWLSSSFTRASGFTLEEAQTFPIERLFPPQSVDKFTELFTKAFEDELAGRAKPDQHWDLDAEAYLKDGSTHWLENRLQFIRDEQGKPTAIMIQGRDITDRKLAEQARDESEENYRLLAENTSDVISILDMNMNTTWISPSFTRASGFTLEEAQTFPIESLFPPESVKKLTELFTKAFEDEMAGHAGPEQHYDVDIEASRKDGSTHWTENRMQFIRDEQGNPTAIMIQGRDITERKKAEETLELSMTRLENTVDGAIAAMATVIEMRDPYTAGHQLRVARIAGAVASEMGLPDDLVKGVEITGKIHDIGKIYVPMEILSKPGKLNPIERQIIQTHARGSYDILKSIDFPWPVAQTALQHHERLDGSGYPHGLKENEIMLEAKILMVADVVEAMASHRPYRASRGLEAAMEEISTNRGSLYDASVVDACLRLFREKGFSFEEKSVEP